MASEIVDDKSEHCIPFILEKIKAHCDYHKKEGTDAPPFFLGLNGIQGAGKTTLVSNVLIPHIKPMRKSKCTRSSLVTQTILLPPLCHLLSADIPFLHHQEHHLTNPPSGLGPLQNPNLTTSQPTHSSPLNRRPLPPPLRSKVSRTIPTHQPTNPTPRSTLHPRHSPRQRYLLPTLLPPKEYPRPLLR